MNNVNLYGVVIMLAAAATVLFARKIATRLPKEKQPNAELSIKLAGLLVCVAGCLIAIYL